MGEMQKRLKGNNVELEQSEGKIQLHHRNETKAISSKGEVGYYSPALAAPEMSLLWSCSPF